MTRYEPNVYNLEKGVKYQFWGRNVTFSAVGRGREGEKKKSKLVSPIYGVPSVEILRAKNENSSTQRGLRVGIKNKGFHRGFKQGVWEIKCFGFMK